MLSEKEKERIKSLLSEENNTNKTEPETLKSISDKAKQRHDSNSESFEGKPLDNSGVKEERKSEGKSF